MTVIGAAPATTSNGASPRPGANEARSAPHSGDTGPGRGHSGGDLGASTGVAEPSSGLTPASTRLTWSSWALASFCLSLFWVVPGLGGAVAADELGPVAADADADADAMPALATDALVDRVDGVGLGAGAELLFVLRVLHAPRPRHALPTAPRQRVAAARPPTQRYPPSADRVRIFHAHPNRETQHPTPAPRPPSRRGRPQTLPARRGHEGTASAYTPQGVSP